MEGLLHLGFIGGGQMAEALIRGLLGRGVFSPDRIIVSEPVDQRRDHLSQEFHVRVSKDSEEVTATARIVILAVKPQVVPAVLASISSGITAEHLVVSIAAGITLETLEERLPPGTRVVRVMPNTPALIQAGASALSGGRNARPEDLRLVEDMLNAVGRTVVLPESLMDAVTGLSGSGPAYVFTFIQGLIDAGVGQGIPRRTARELVVQTVIGAAMMCQQSDSSPDELTAQVTSPGGTTIAGLHVLERNAFRGILMDAVKAATQRSQEMGRSG